jgi:predicted ATPase
MYLRSMRVENYRSVRSLFMRLDAVNLFVGENGTGKSNLYRSLQLLKAAADGRFSHEIASEGGLSSVFWSGELPKHRKRQILLEAELADERTGQVFGYRLVAGFKMLTAAGFALEAQIKEEELSLLAGRRTHVMMRRKESHIAIRDGDGRMTDHPDTPMASETALNLLAGSGHFPEISLVRHVLGQWRFYHGFRTDPASPLRRPCHAVTAPMLEEDGSNIAAVFATLAHIRGDTVDLDRAVYDAFSGAAIAVPEPDSAASFGLVVPEFPKRVFDPRELSDGQIRFLGLAAALLSYRRPGFIALNEPEASLHPDMLPALAGLIARASADSQIWVVTHSHDLADAVSQRCGARVRTVVRRDGSTGIEGLSPAGELAADEVEAQSG